MILITDLDSVQDSWDAIESAGCPLHGFFLYAAADSFFPEYMSKEGLADLEQWTGNNCALFIFQPISKEWIEYTHATNHVWWQLFNGEPEVLRILLACNDAPVLQTKNGLKSFRDVFAPCHNQIWHGIEIAKILRRFNLEPTKHPCLVLFRDLRDAHVWYVDCRDMIGMPKDQLRISLQKWFDGKDFKKLLREVSNA